jgi:hypothetical protein
MALESGPTAEIGGAGTLGTPYPGVLWGKSYPHLWRGGHHMDNERCRSMRTRWLTALFTLLLLLPFGGVAHAKPPGGSRPPGNNGTVKIDGMPWDDAPNNEPHVDCTFQIDLYGYDEGDLQATYTLELWAPTGNGTLRSGTVEIGEDAAGGGRDLDASVTIDLEQALLSSAQPPHPQQGFHVRLTIHADGSIGADVKHKMLWLQCAGSGGSTSPTITPSPSESVGPSSGGASNTVSPTESESASVSGVPSASTTVLGESGTAGPSSSAVAPATAFTGADVTGLFLLATALLLLGAIGLRLGSRRFRRP